MSTSPKTPSDSVSAKRADFAIVIPVGPGVRPWLSHTLRSLAAQPAKMTVALCAVEDTPQLQEMIKAHGALIDYIRIGPDRGQSEAINEGWAALDARFYGWLNDDDMLHPHATQIALELFDSGASIVHGRTGILRDNIVDRGYGAEPVTDRILFDNVIAQPSTFIRKDALRRVDLDPGRSLSSPVDPDLHYSMDWDLWQRLYLAGERFVMTEACLSMTRWHDEAKTAALSRTKYREYFRLLRRHTSFPRTIWTLFNMAVHTLANYGQALSLFKVIAIGLAKLRPAPDNSEERTGPVPLTLFHYADHPLTVYPLSESEPSGESISLYSGQAIALNASKARLDP